MINRPEKRNAFTPKTGLLLFIPESFGSQFPVSELSLCFADAHDDPAVGVVVLTGKEWNPDH